MWQNSKTVIRGVQDDDEPTQGNALSVWSFPPRCWSALLHLLTRNCPEINTFSHRTEAQILVVWEFFSNFANRKRQIRVELWESWELFKLRTENWELRGMITVRAGRAYELRTERWELRGMITIRAGRAYELRTGRVERYGYDLLLGQQAITPLPIGGSRQLPHCRLGPAGNYPIAVWGQQAITTLSIWEALCSPFAFFYKKKLNRWLIIN